MPSAVHMCTYEIRSYAFCIRKRHQLSATVVFNYIFDTLRHDTFAQLLNTLDVPDNIYNCFLEYFRGHVTKFAGVTSSIARINASVVQGSVVGPVSFITCSSSLHPKQKCQIYTLMTLTC